MIRIQRFNNPFAYFPNPEKMNFEVALLNQFKLRREYREQLESYYILHWSADYLVEKLEPDGTLIHADVSYIPIYQFDTGSLFPKQQVKLSFRRQRVDLSNAYTARHYVLIRGTL